MINKLFAVALAALLAVSGAAIASESIEDGGTPSSSTKKKRMKESPIVGTYWVDEGGPEKVSREEAIKSLPCFGCHSAEIFTAAPEKGKFSHALHSGFDVHCNQCHEVKGHMPPKINEAACNGCHSLKDLSYAGGGMGAVAFSHKRHTKMFGCSDCHTKLFNMKKGSIKMLMDDMYAGKGCGSCHNGKAAFESSGDCTKCHKG